MAKKRIGIYAGTFDPVHAGHIAFALQAAEIANLEAVYFLPERRPRSKQQVEHFAHRVAMINQAVKPHNHLNILELVDISFSVERTLPKLKQMFKNAELVFLFGSDIIKSLPSWPKSERLISNYEIVVSLRSRDNRQDLKQLIDSWTIKPKALTIFDSYAPGVSSFKIRQALRKRRPTKGSLSSVERYSDQHWLYISLAVDKT